MEQLIATLITQGGLGVVAAIFFWLYISERNDHKKTRDAKDVLLEARRLDAKDTVDKVTGPLSSISDTLKLVYDKLVVSKQRGL